MMKNPAHSERPPERLPAARRLFLGAVAAVVLALVFLAYLQPEFVFDLANRIILCF